MDQLIRMILLLAIMLLVPIVPFLLFGPWLQEWISTLLVSAPSRQIIASIVVSVLATDIFLPVPSSLVSTLAGSQLGTGLGTLSCFTGMTIGAAFGFGLARHFGRPLVLRLAGSEDLNVLEHSCKRMGVFLLVLLRALPVLAEASVLMLGALGMPWKVFLPAVILSNLGISLAYTAFGEFASTNQWLPAAMGLSVAVPVLATAFVRRILTRSSSAHTDSSESTP